MFLQLPLLFLFADLHDLGSAVFVRIKEHAADNIHPVFAGGIIQILHQPADPGDVPGNTERIVVDHISADFFPGIFVPDNKTVQRTDLGSGDPVHKVTNDLALLGNICKIALFGFDLQIEPEEPRLPGKFDLVLENVFLQISLIVRFAFFLCRRSLCGNFFCSHRRFGADLLHPLDKRHHKLVRAAFGIPVKIPGHTEHRQQNILPVAAVDLFHRQLLIFLAECLHGLLPTLFACIRAQLEICSPIMLPASAKAEPLIEIETAADVFPVLVRLPCRPEGFQKLLFIHTKLFDKGIQRLPLDLPEMRQQFRRLAAEIFRPRRDRSNIALHRNRLPGIQFFDLPLQLFDFRVVTEHLGVPHNCKGQQDQRPDNSAAHDNEQHQIVFYKTIHAMTITS